MTKLLRIEEVKALSLRHDDGVLNIFVRLCLFVGELSARATFIC